MPAPSPSSGVQKIQAPARKAATAITQSRACIFFIKSISSSSVG
jgi:hypothetical protein